MKHGIPNVKKYLNEVLSEFNVTQKDFAQLLELNEKTVCRWIRRNELPRYVVFIIELAMKLHKHRNISFARILTKYLNEKNQEQ